MAVSLILRPGDPQAIKVLSAAAVSGTEVSLTALAESKKISSESLPAFGSHELLCTLEDGCTILTEPNAMASYVYGSDETIDLSTRTWLEWEAAVLRKAVYGGNQEELNNAIKKLEEASSMGLKTFNVACEYPDLVDIVISCTLHAARMLQLTLPCGVDQYVASVFSTEPMKKAIELAYMGKEEDTVTALVQEDAQKVKSCKPKLPQKGKRNVLVTSALPYVNNVPHLGNIIGCVLSADVYARFCRARGYNCIYICGTDEYGTATETKALEEGLSCQDICDKYYAIHKDVYDWFDISFDKFGRTPTRYQTEIGQESFAELQRNGYLVEQTMEQLYSEALQKFLADRFVIGTCPKCRYEDARGDQCDACGALLNPTELIDPRCKVTGTTPVVRETRHIFLDLPKLSNSLQSYIEKTSSHGGWSPNCMNVTKAWMDQGLKVRCITRDLKWGTPVPLEGFENKVFYVWFDAPIGYVSITASYCGDSWRAWWIPSEYYGKEEAPEVELVQFMGKDNVPFHTVIFPATQLGTGRPWTMMRSISVTEYLNYEDGKFSKSRGVGVFGNDAKDTGIAVDVWRYYLLAVRPESQDAAFQWDDFAAKNNAELNDNLGNFINRTLKFIFSRFDRTVPGGPSHHNGAGSGPVAELGNKVSSLVEDYIQALESQKLRSALQIAMAVSRAGNVFFQDTEIWAAYKTDLPAASAYISACAGVVALLAALLEPFMPSFSRNLLKQMNLSASLKLTDEIVEQSKSIADLIPVGHVISTQEPKPLFRKILESEVEEMRSKFAGAQSDRKSEQASKKSKSDEKTAKNEKQKQKVKADGENKAAQGKKPSTKDDTPVDISRINLRVGHILKAWRHPDAESLYVEEVDVGEEKPRTVVSGLVKFIPEAEMQNRRVVLVCNLKPANMRGIKSEAMVLAATSQDGSSVELVEPPESSTVGEPVTVAGFNGEPDDMLNPKKKVWERIQPDLITNENLQACYRGTPLSTSKGVCKVKSIVGGHIK